MHILKRAVELVEMAAVDRAYQSHEDLGGKSVHGNFFRGLKLDRRGLNLMFTMALQSEMC